MLLCCTVYCIHLSLLLCFLWFWFGWRTIRYDTIRYTLFFYHSCFVVCCVVLCCVVLCCDVMCRIYLSILFWLWFWLWLCYFLILIWGGRNVGELWIQYTIATQTRSRPPIYLVFSLYFHNLLLPVFYGKKDRLPSLIVLFSQSPLLYTLVVIFFLSSFSKLPTFQTTKTEMHHLKQKQKRIPLIRKWRQMDMYVPSNPTY